MGEYFREQCRRCGRPKRAGDIFYLVRMTLTCDFDGKLPELEEADLEQGIKEQLDRADQKEEQELMDEVFQELNFFICKNCRDWLVKSWMATDDGRGARNG
jgi:hypothetical protein